MSVPELLEYLENRLTAKMAGTRTGQRFVFWPRESFVVAIVAVFPSVGYVPFPAPASQHHGRSCPPYGALESRREIVCSSRDVLRSEGGGRV